MLNHSVIVVSICLMMGLILTACQQESYGLADGLVQDLKDNTPDVDINYVYDGVLEFVPNAQPIYRGIIFYPGAYVDYRAYAPLMSQLAQNGFLCVLVKPTKDFALFDKNIALRLMKQYPETDRWYLAGHSLGGATAAMCVAGHSDRFDGLILLAAYSTKDLSNSGLRVISVYGSEDQVLNREKYERYRNNLPSDLAETVIAGGCHSFFAQYGHQQGDGTPIISRDEQMSATVYAIVKGVR